MSQVDWHRVDAALGELFDSAPIDAAVDEGLLLGDQRFMRTLRMLQVVATAAVVAVTGAALLVQNTVHAESEQPPAPPPGRLPVVASISPNEGSHEGGQTVVITGRRLATTEAVLFDDTPVTDFISVADQELVLVTPPHAPDTVPVTVVADNGSPSRPRTSYRFLEAPRSTLPVLARVSPDSGPAAGGTEVTIWGTRLLGATKVSFGGVPLEKPEFRSVTDTSITVATPRHEPGTVDVTVTTGAGTSGAQPFTYRGDTPATLDVDGVRPAFGPLSGGNEVVVSGSHLTPATTVEFGGATADIVSVTDAEIRVVVPGRDSPGAVDVRVAGAGASANLPAGYTYLPPLPPPPTITQVTPTEGPTSGDQKVTILGTALAGASKVSIGGVEATLLASSESSLTLLTPEHDPGFFEVTVTTPGGTSASSKAAVYRYVAPPPPVIKKLTPSGSVRRHL